MKIKSGINEKELNLLDELNIKEVTSLIFSEYFDENSNNFEFSQEIFEEEINKLSEENFFYCTAISKIYDKIYFLKEEIKRIKISIEILTQLNKSIKLNSSCWQISSDISQINSIKIESTENFKEISSPYICDNQIWSILLLNQNNQNKYIITGEADGKITIWNIETVIKYKTFHEHTSYINCLNSFKNNLFVSGSDDCLIKIWDITADKSIRTICNTSPIYSIARLLNLNKHYIAFGDYENKITIYDFNKGITIKIKKNANFHYVFKLIYLENIYQSSSCQTNLLISVGFNDIVLWDLNKFEKIRTYQEHSFQIMDVIQIKDNKLASCGFDKIVKIWDITSEKSLTSIKLDHFSPLCFLCMSFISQENFLLVGCEKYFLLLDTSENGKIIQKYETSEKIHKLVEYKGILYSCNWENNQVKRWIMIS